MIEAILRRPVSIIVGTIAVAALGAFALLKLPLSLLPQIERPSLVVVARASSMSRDELVHDVTIPVERRLALVAGITSIESETRDGEARITIASAWQTDPDRLRIDVARRIEGAAGVALDDLTIESKTDAAPVIEVAVVGGSGAVRSRIADRVVLPELARVEGAGRIEVIGATPMRVTVTPHAADLAARSLTAADVEQRLRTVGRTLTAGRVREGAAVRPVVVAEPIRSIADLAAIHVKGVPLREVAAIEMREVSDETLFRVVDVADGSTHDGVLLRVERAPNANAVALARGVRSRIAELRPRLRDAAVRVVVDRSGDVSRALAELAIAALSGILLGTLILRWMLGRWTPTLALSAVIPAALLASFTAFYAAGVPLDVISLSGLALATGLLVDNSIVVLESIETMRASGARDAVAAGTRQIILAVIASSITLMIVFAPLLYLRGVARALFGEQALAVVVSVGASIILSLTLTPVLANFGHAAEQSRYPGREAYVNLLDRALRAPRTALAGGALVIVAGLAIGLLLQRELFARGAERDVVVDVRLPVDVEATAARVSLMSVWSTIRSSIDGHSVAAMWLTRAAAADPARIDIRFRSASAARKAVEQIKTRLTSSVPIARTSVRLRPSAFVEAVGGDATRVDVVASAAADSEAARLASRMVGAMQARGFRVADDARTSEGRLAVALQWDERLLEIASRDRRSIEGDVRAALGNIDAGQSEVRTAEPAIRLLPTTPEDVALAPVRLASSIAPVKAVAGLRLVPRAAAVLHDERRPARKLSFEGGDANLVDGALSAVAPRGSERLRLAGHARELRDAFAQMRLALVLASILLYLTVAAFYESLLLPLPVIAALPFAAAGAFAALFITSQTLNIMSLLGLIFLGGVVVNHTVVLLDRVEQLRVRGEPEDDAIRLAAADRYRPVIMTTLIAIVGMLPLALFGGPGVELRRSIAVVVIGGLLTATAGTLILIPLLHRALEPFRTRSRRRVHA